ncbi:hypothetical protein [Massilia brevitalea]|uniref:hypothetical protein n=1 Tax=Massilia brevitalea TaxID=442526 RepID=UPI002739F425|nr:hypothetical protein [Massilia brevitalea]
MTQSTPKRSTLILAVNAALTLEQRQKIEDRVRVELPADVGVILLDSSVKIAAILPAAE